ncbi:MAG: CehA/McbA family metallohydrolase [Verrucomicrobiaceae bacterium]|nr:CehA/McbA family metallohydrolase [Verrucomicrobiaceae bacterium]
MHRLLTSFALLFTIHASAAETVLESRRLHLGKAGAYEWDEFKDRKVDAERLELHFQSQANTSEQVLRVWQRDVKLNWPVLLNGKKLGILTTAETPMETIYPLAPGILKEGGNVLIIEPPPNLDDIEIGPVILETQTPSAYLSAAKIEVTVTDESLHPIPCRLTLTRRDGTLQPLIAEPQGEVAARTGVVYTKDGKVSLSVPAGDYELRAGRGFEWSIAMQPISVKAGDALPVTLKLKREVDTTGWIAADSHIHTLTHSGHGDATIEERMLTIAGEGIELAISTDHNHHTDFAPAAASVGVAAAFTPVIGNEVTTKHGHFNAFPVPANAPVVDAKQENWAQLIPAIRSMPGVQVITLNHPRDLHSGFVPLGGLHFNPKTGRHRDAEAMDIDAIEVVTSAAMQSDVHLLYRDWFAMLNRGHRFAAVASSDSHDVNRFILGQGRTYVAAKDDDPSGLNPDEVWRSYHEGRLIVSLGLLTHMKVDDHFGVGDLATGLKDKLKVEITILGPSWVRADHLELYANGVLIREQAVKDAGQPGIKAHVSFELPRPSHDVHLVAIATGPGVKEPFWEIPRPYQPTSKTFTSRVIGSTNPIWIDADGDGRFDSAYQIAQKLVRRFGIDSRELHEAASQCDDAVRIQLDTLRTER